MHWYKVDNEGVSSPRTDLNEIKQYKKNVNFKKKKEKRKKENRTILSLPCRNMKWSLM